MNPTTYNAIGAGDQQDYETAAVEVQKLDDAALADLISRTQVAIDAAQYKYIVNQVAKVERDRRGRAAQIKGIVGA